MSKLDQGVDIPWPAKGLSENWGYSQMPPVYTRDCQNVRYMDPVNGRLRGATRAGLTKVVTDPIVISGTTANLILLPEIWTGGNWITNAIEASQVSGQANPFGETSPNPAVLLKNTGSPTPGTWGNTPTGEEKFATLQVLSAYFKRPTTGSLQTDSADLFWDDITTNGIGTRILIATDGTMTLSTIPGGNVAGLTKGISLIGNGWYRVFIAMDSAASGGLITPGVTTRSNLVRNNRFVSEGGAPQNKELWVWGMHLIEGTLTMPSYRTGFSRVQALETITVDDKRHTYATAFGSPAPTLEYTRELSSPIGVPDMAVAPDGSWWVIDGTTAISHVSKEGYVLESLTLNLEIEASESGSQSGLQLTCIDVDPFGDVWVGAGVTEEAMAAGSYTLPAAAVGRYGAIYRISRGLDGVLRTVWQIKKSSTWNNVLGQGNPNFVTDLEVRNGLLYITTWVDNNGSEHRGHVIVCTNIYVELAKSVQVYWKTFLDSLPTSTSTNANTERNFPMCITTSDTGELFVSTVRAVTGTQSARLFKYNADGPTRDGSNYKPRWVATTGTSSPVCGAGIGSGCSWAEVGSTRYIFVTGTTAGSGNKENPGAQTNFRVNRFTDNGATFTFTSGSSAGVEYDWRMLRPTTDSYGNFWVAHSASASDNVVLQGWTTALTEILSGGGYTLTSTNEHGYGAVVKHDGTVVDYMSSAITVPEKLVVGSGNRLPDSVTSSEVFHRVRIVNITGTTGSPRSVKNVAVVGGMTFLYTTGGVKSQPIGSGSGSLDLDSTSLFVQLTPFANKVFMLDGLKYLYYDPKLNLVDPDGEIKDWSRLVLRGELPPRCKLMTEWRGRLVLARGDDEQGWFMCASLDPFDWDYLPPVPTTTSAVSGGTGRAGRCPDVVNALIPYNDDILLYGCDHTIFMLRGDPMEGGVFDLVSDITGMAFGRAWCKDPNGVIFFYGSMGGVFVMQPGGLPERLSYETIDRRLMDIDLSANFIRMAWNYRHDGLAVTVIPYGTITSANVGTFIRTHYFWERKAGAWWPDVFGEPPQLTEPFTSSQPTAIITLDGDLPADRILVHGTASGHVVKVDEASTSDVGGTIDAHVLLGPYGWPDREMRLTRLRTVLDSTRNGVTYDVFVTNNPDLLGSSVYTGTLTAGRNPAVPARGRGSHVYVKYRNATLNQRFAHESTAVQIADTGRPRDR